MDIVRIGTRGSKLALWQAYHVADLLKAGGLGAEIITIETKGDKIQDVSIAKIGSKGVFTQEIEEQLHQEKIDIAVHSAKDMQSELPEGFELIAYTTREKVNDVIVSHNKTISLSNKKPYTIGTSSTRRIAMLKQYYPHISTVEMRGNLQTRIRKMEEGQCDALLLAYAGVSRMDYNDLIAEILPEDVFTPAVGQGSVTVEISSALPADKKALIRQFVNHPETECRLLAERAFLRKMHGGCSIPVFALAKIDGNQLHITGGLASLDGQLIIRKTLYDSLENAVILGERLGIEVLEAGGKSLLADIRAQLNKSAIYHKNL